MRRFFYLFLLMSICSSCGYTTGSLLPSNYRVIAVDAFKNRVGYLNENIRGLYIPLLEIKAHDAIIHRFQMDGHLKVNNNEKADLVLQGDLVGFDREDVRTDDNNNIQEYRVRITVALKLIDPSEGKEIWSESAFSGEATYYTSGPQAKSESAALEEALTDLSRRVVERTLENW